MKMYQNELNYMQTAWTVGYTIGQLPSNIILTRIRPRYWIPALEVRNSVHLFSMAYHFTHPLCHQVIWSILTLSLSRCNSASQFYVVRFFIGKILSSFADRRSSLHRPAINATAQVLPKVDFTLECTTLSVPGIERMNSQSGPAFSKQAAPQQPWYLPI